jgi:prefoldin subunit 5
MTLGFSKQGIYLMGVNEVADDSWNAHSKYLEDEVKKIEERAEKLENMIPDLKNEPKKHACRKLINDLRDEASQHRKYLALVKRFIQHE